MQNTLSFQVFLLLYASIGVIQPLPSQNQSSSNSFQLVDDNLYFQQVKTDTLFDSPQIISILTLLKNDSSYQFDLAHHSTKRIRTSDFAQEATAIAAINGGFFNMDKGGSVTYLEEGDRVFQRNIPHGIKWSIANWAKTGAIIIQKNGQLQIEAARDQQYYEKSKAESGVLVTGPLLLQQGKKVRLAEAQFTYKRHPRTCLCETKNEYLLITIDGRQTAAAGMSLIEMQTFLLEKGCLEAINLDGGGSTTMWIKDKGVVNQPSDAFGERTVANAILIKKRN